MVASPINSLYDTQSQKESSSTAKKSHNSTLKAGRKGTERKREESEKNATANETYTRLSWKLIGTLCVYNVYGVLSMVYDPLKFHAR